MMALVLRPTDGALHLRSVALLAGSGTLCRRLSVESLLILSRLARWRVVMELWRELVSDAPSSADPEEVV